jgi:ER membrane protein complex subunit 4
VTEGLYSKTKSAIKPSNSAAVLASQAKLKQSRAWDLAISPVKQLPMQAIMLYMSGSGIQIFTIGIVFMLLSSPLKAVSSINKSIFIH